ncbi:PH domain-containing protein [Salsuginibacillus kocurii]|uniref:PH domain-containing protein n=1 Tax=Salsuginibacillus kocurii TaxID=427078 RepID=UPI000374257F|nr:PH domain-containing protein [Salsuginibacillus kocurii]
MKFNTQKNPFLVILPYLFLFLAGFILVDEGFSFLTLLISITLAVFGSMLLYALFTSYFILTDEMLVIRYGWYKKTIPLQEIRQVNYTNNLINAYAWTFTRLKITTTSEYCLYSKPKPETDFFMQMDQAGIQVEYPHQHKET